MRNYLKRRWRRLKKPLVLLVLCICLLAPCIMSSATTDDDNYSNYDYYTLSSVASSTFSNALAKGEVESVFGDIPSNGAGALLGFCDENKTRGINILQILTSTSTAEYSYKGLLPAYSDASLTPFMTASGGHVFAPYVVLGAVLSDCGLDSTGIGIGTSDIIRKVTGGIILVLYALSMVVPALFSFVLSFLKKLNPFQFFATAGMGNMAGSYASLAGEGTTKFAAVTEFVRQWYVILQNMGVWVIALFLAVLAVTVLLNKKAAREVSIYKRFLIRAAFIIFGIPLLGSSYTMMLDQIQGMVDGGNMAAARVIASSFCDFGGFVNNGMKFDGSLQYTYNSTTGTITAGPNVNPQSLCLAINMASNSALDAGWAVYDQNAQDGGISEMVEAMQGGSGQEDAEISAWAYDVLSRYMRGDKITSADFAGKEISNKWLTLNKDGLEDVEEFVTSHSKVHDYDNDNGEIWTLESPRINPFNIHNNAAGSTGPFGTKPVSGDANVQDYSGWAPSNMSIYNYLNTKFSSSKMTVYSSERTSSDAVREHHYSVNMAGNGFAGAIVFLTAVCMLLTDTVIGIYYAFGIVMKNLSRGIRLILSVPMAMLGSLQAIARIITYTVVMILEVLGSIMAYAIITELLYTLLVAFNGQLATSLAFSTNYLMPVAGMLSMVFGIVTIVFLIWFMTVAIKLRKNLIHSLDQCAEAVISKFVIGSPQPTGALSGKEMKQVGQLGVTKNQSAMQRAGSTLVRGVETAAHAGMTAVMLTSGNVPGALNQAAQTVRGVGKTKDAATDDGGSMADGTNDPYESGRKTPSGTGIESKVKPLGISGQVSGVPSVVDENGNPSPGPDLPDMPDGGGSPSGPKGTSPSGGGLTAVQNNVNMTKGDTVQGGNLSNVGSAKATVTGSKNFGNGNNIQITGMPVPVGGRGSASGSTSGGNSGGIGYSEGMSGGAPSSGQKSVYGRQVTNGRMTSENNVTVDERTNVRRMQSMSDTPGGKSVAPVSSGSTSETVSTQKDIRYVENTNVSQEQQVTQTVNTSEQVMERRKTVQSVQDEGQSAPVSKSFGKKGKKWF